MKNKILVYDDHCPLCLWYSGLFVKYGFLEADGRQAFSSLDANWLARIDFDKSRNEIPLLDLASGQVLYGIDALLEILDSKIPLIKKTGNLKPVKWLLNKLYKLVSYNRKLIVAKKCGTGDIDCSPDINYFYRFMFLFFSLLLNSLLLFPLHENVLTKLSYYHLDIAILQTGHFAFVLINCLLAFRFPVQKASEYLGQVNMLALTVNLLLLPLQLVTLYFPDEQLISVYLVVMSAFIFKEYLRRMDYAGVLTKNHWVVSINLLCLTGFLLFLLS
jgi:predicted DCC family thiol-disulfide oxidoreductase YuxK